MRSISQYVVVRKADSPVRTLVLCFLSCSLFLLYLFCLFLLLLILYLVSCFVFLSLFLFLLILYLLSYFGTDWGEMSENRKCDQYVVWWRRWTAPYVRSFCVFVLYSYCTLFCLFLLLHTITFSCYPTCFFKVRFVLHLLTPRALEFVYLHWYYCKRK